MVIDLLERDSDNSEGIESLYATARLIMRFQQWGAKNFDLLPHERARLSEGLDKARQNGHAVLKQGFMVAKWLMILTHFKIDAEILESDRECIQLAVWELVKEANIFILSSLVRTCDYLGIDVHINSDDFDTAFPPPT